MSLDWQTEESGWDEKPAGKTARPPDELYSRRKVTPEEPPPPPPGRKRRLLPLLLAAGLALAVLVGVAYRQLDNRVAEGQRRAEDDVRASYATLQDAAEAGDRELFNSFLSGRDPEWADAQMLRVAAGSLTDRSNFALHAIAPSAVVSPTVTLSADLNSAELDSEQAYEVAIGSNLTETIVLTHKLVFRRAADRWLLAAPEPDFWGTSQTVRGVYGAVSFPERDAAVARRLARDLEATLADVCDELTEGCGPIQVEMVSDPTTLAGRVAPRNDEGATLELFLPAPTLFGIPAGETGFRAMSRQYSARAASAVVEAYTGDCCPGDPFYEGLNEAFLHRLGLRPWQLPPGELEAILHDPHPLAGLNELWATTGGTEDAAGTLTLYTLVEFLANGQGNMPIVEMQRLLGGRPHVGSLWDWVSAVTRRRYASQLAFERDWLQYIASRSAATTRGVSDLPQQDLQLICRTTGTFDNYLYRYDIETETLEREHKLAAFAQPMLAPLPDREGVIVFGRNYDGLHNLPYLWREGAIVPLQFETADRANFYPLPAQSGRDRLVFFEEDGRSVSSFFVLPYEHCTGGASCAAEWVVGAPLESPGGAQALFLLGAPTPLTKLLHDPLIYLGDSEAQKLGIVGYGWSPFWLDDARFGHVANPLRPTGQEIVLRDVESQKKATEEPGGSRILTGDTLLTAAALFNAESGEGIVIDYVTSDPAGENLFIFTAPAADLSALGRMLVYNLQDGQLETRLEFDNEVPDYLRHYALSPDGRWMTISALRAAVEGLEAAVWTIYVLNLSDGATFEYDLVSDDYWAAGWRVDWSSDGRWMLMNTEGYIRLIAPAEQQNIPLFIEDKFCSAAVWVNEG